VLMGWAGGQGAANGSASQVGLHHAVFAAAAERKWILLYLQRGNLATNSASLPLASAGYADARRAAAAGASP